MPSSNSSLKESGIVSFADIARALEWSDESGTVNSGNAGVVGKFHLEDGDTVEVFEAKLLLDTGAPAPTDLNLLLITEDNSGGGVERAKILQGDGSTVFDKEAGELATWENTTGSGQTMAVVVDNGNFGTGTGSNQDVYAEFKAELQE